MRVRSCFRWRSTLVPVMKGRQGILRAYNAQAVVSPVDAAIGRGMVITAADVPCLSSLRGLHQRRPCRTRSVDRSHRYLTAQAPAVDDHRDGLLAVRSAQGGGRTDLGILKEQRPNCCQLATPASLLYASSPCCERSNPCSSSSPRTRRPTVNFKANRMTRVITKAHPQVAPIIAS